MTVAQNIRQYIARRDLGIMRSVHGWPAPRWIRWWMISATRGGDGWLWGGLGLVLLLFGGPDRFLAVGEAALASALGILVFRETKRRTGRLRPCVLEPHCWSTLLPPDQFSFPSGHTITAFAVVTPIHLYYPAAAPVLVFCALSVAASRIILGMHFLSDVLAGAILGTLLGYIVHLVLPVLAG